MDAAPEGGPAVAGGERFSKLAQPPGFLRQLAEFCNQPSFVALPPRLPHDLAIGRCATEPKLSRMLTRHSATAWTAYSARIAIIGCTAAARRAEGTPARAATKNAVPAAHP